jgi:hypothetical protein
MPQDGHEKQVCERSAEKRWLTQHAPQVALYGVTVLGDDLYSNQPLCALALPHGCNFIFVCKPDTHPKFYERLAFWQANSGIAELEHRRWHGRFTEVQHYPYINDILLRGGTDALSINWFESTVVNAKTGEQLYHNSFITHHQVTTETVAAVAHAGHGRWKIENYLSITTHYQHNLSLSGADNNASRYQPLRFYLSAIPTCR